VVARGLDGVNEAVTLMERLHCQKRDFSDEFIVISESESGIRILKWWRGD
jgi:hypothetical protein